MKTCAHVRKTTGELLGICMAYYESGKLHPKIQSRVKNDDVDAALLEYGRSREHQYYKKNEDGSFSRDDDVKTVIVDTEDMHGGSGMRFKPIFYYAHYFDGHKLSVDLEKAREIAHKKRRQKREKLLAPHDKLSTSPLASVKNAALAAKQAILDNDSPVQASIDAALTADQMEQALIDYGAV